MQYGTVIKSTGSWYQVRLETQDNQLVNARMTGRFRQDDLPLTNPIAVGDRVGVALETSGDEQTAAIKIIDPRTNYVVRQSPRRKHDLHLLASNIDQAILITTIKEPELKLGFVDRFLLMTEPFSIPTALVINKEDLLNEDAMEMYEGFAGLYESIGYTVMLVSAETGTGIDEFRELLKDKRSLLSGQSGVGKSSLINAVQPDLSLRTGELSDYSGKGQHTTTFAELFELDFGGELIDTPGIKTLSFNYLEPIDVAHNFREIFELSPDCKFGGSCLHRTEPGCAIKESVMAEDGQVSELRYQSYLTLLEEVESQNYWERKKV
ncbi:MAG: ribosome small subunit-dependent GTPase A [Bacteroidota bacterium]